MEPDGMWERESSAIIINCLTVSKINVFPLYAPTGTIFNGKYLLIQAIHQQQNTER